MAGLRPRIPDSDAHFNAAQALMAHLRSFGLPADVLTAFDARLTAATAGNLR